VSNFEFSVLFGGRAGDGIRQLGQLWARLLARRGLRVFLYDDYPSLIRGGHNFTVVRAADFPVLAHRERINLLVALNEETLRRHRERLLPEGFILYDSSGGKELSGLGIPWKEMVRELSAPEITRNTAALASAARLVGIPWEELAATLERDLPRAREINLEVARRAYAATPEPRLELPRGGERLPTLFGNEAVALGAVAAGLRLYVAYPMTPASSILHYLAQHAEALGVTVIHPENEIAAVLCALGAAAAGAPAMTGTSGGGFALMVEALSLAGQAELPLLIVESQRPGPSTGVPTYTAQADLDFVTCAGHGEFPRVVLAPGDAEEAFRLSARGLSLVWEYQIPVILLLDKHVSESLFNQELPLAEVPRVNFRSWEGEEEYQRYAFTEDGISPLAFPGDPRAVVKVTSYEHDPYGITTEDPEAISRMQEKRLRKGEGLRRSLDAPEMVRTEGKGEVALCVWGSGRGAGLEVARALGLRYVQPLVLEPFPEKALRAALSGVRRVLVAETNATGQLARRLAALGFPTERILKYDGRPFTVDGLASRVKEVLG